MSLPPPLSVSRSAAGSSVSAASSCSVTIGRSSRPRMARFAYSNGSPRSASAALSPAATRSAHPRRPPSGRTSPTPSVKLSPIATNRTLNLHFGSVQYSPWPGLSRGRDRSDPLLLLDSAAAAGEGGEQVDRVTGGFAMGYLAADERYDAAVFRRCGRSGLELPAISLGLWHNFGDAQPFETQRAILRRAFDRGITHFDLANNYGPPYGSAEANFGTLFAQDLRPYRDELILSSKAGYDMWPGPYGQGGGSRKYVLASLDQSLARMGLDYVDIFYSHRFDPTTPLEETMGALDTAVRSGKALYAGISSYGPGRTREAVAILRELGTP